MCLYPRKAFLEKHVDINGEVFQKLKFSDKGSLTVPCGHCIECLIQKSNEWAYRICLEAKSHDQVCMITLTYNEENNDKQLHKDHYQKWLKRIRKKYGKLRYFLCGEYGSLHQRPHYHCILFGKDFNDKKFHHWEYGKNGKKHAVYVSDELQQTWQFGFTSIVDLSFWSAKYCAKYMQKLQDIPEDWQQPFLAMSLKPGLGQDYFMKNMDQCLSTDKIYFNGDTYHLPRYFLKLACMSGRGVEVEQIHEQRKVKADLMYNDEAIQNKIDKYKHLTDIRL